MATLSEECNSSISRNCPKGRENARRNQQIKTGELYDDHSSLFGKNNPDWGEPHVSVKWKGSIGFHAGQVPTNDSSASYGFGKGQKSGQRSKETRTAALGRGSGIVVTWSILHLALVDLLSKNIE